MHYWSIVAQCHIAPLWLNVALLMCGTMSQCSGVAQCHKAPVWLNVTMLWCGSMSQCSSVAQCHNAPVWLNVTMLWCGSISQCSGVAQCHIAPVWLNVTMLWCGSMSHCFGVAQCHIAFPCSAPCPWWRVSEFPRSQAGGHRWHVLWGVGQPCPDLDLDQGRRDLDPERSRDRGGESCPVASSVESGWRRLQLPVWQRDRASLSRHQTGHRR